MNWELKGLKLGISHTIKIQQMHQVHSKNKSVNSPFLNKIREHALSEKWPLITFKDGLNSQIMCSKFLIGGGKGGQGEDLNTRLMSSGRFHSHFAKCCKCNDFIALLYTTQSPKCDGPENIYIILLQQRFCFSSSHPSGNSKFWFIFCFNNFGLT